MTIKLAEPGCLPDALTISHLPPSQYIDPSSGSSAPRGFRLWAITDLHLFSSTFSSVSVLGAQTILEGEFQRPESGKQTWEVQRKAAVRVKVVSLEVLGNWGNEEYTCVYRVRVHPPKVEG